MKKTSTFQNGLIWFGAGVSLAEILTGTSFASLGFTQGFAAIVTGHVIGCILLFLAGLIGGRSGKSAMETVKMSFGQKGGLLFAVLNVLQLVGWTAIMIYDGALAAEGVFPAGHWVWCLVIGGLILVWILVGVTNLGWINKISMSALLVLTVVLCGVIVSSGPTAAGGSAGEAMSFGAAVELAVAMPLSWLPLVSDYTREAEKPFQATLASTAVYGLVSVWMYTIGMGAAIYTGASDIAAILVRDPEIQVAGLAANGREALELCEKHQPDVVLMDMRMPEYDGSWGISAIKKHFPQIRVMVLTTFDDQETVDAAIHSGADGYILKEMEDEKLIRAVKTVYGGIRVFGDSVFEGIRQKLDGYKGGRKDRGGAPLPELTSREKDIMRCVAEGMDNREIAAKLFLAEGTVRNNLSRLLDKLNLKDRTQLAVFAVKNHLDEAF